MDNKRKAPRKKLIAFTPVYDLLHKTLLGYIGDLTPQGVMVIGQKQFEVNKHFTMGIEFPSDDSESHTLKIVTSARVAWCRPDDTPNEFNIGFEFLDVSPENLKIIDAALTRYQFRYVMDISDLKP